eukprot:369986-Rhodomonas_salina.2
MGVERRRGRDLTRDRDLDRDCGNVTERDHDCGNVTDQTCRCKKLAGGMIAQQMLQDLSRYHTP